METKWTLRRIGIASTVKTIFLISFVIGIIVGVIWAMVFALFSSVIGVMLDQPLPNVGVTTVIVLPLMSGIFYAAVGTATSFLFTLLYNITAGFLGGIELELVHEQRDEPTPFI